MNLINALNQFYYDMTLFELKMMNDRTIYPNITYNSLLYLDLISYKKNSTVSQLSGLLNISKSAVTIKVNELIKQGFVTKTQSDKDKRVFFLSISPTIEKEYKHYDKKLNNAIKVLKNQYSPKEIEMFGDMLTLIRQNYQ